MKTNKFFNTSCLLGGLCMANGSAPADLNDGVDSLGSDSEVEATAAPSTCGVQWIRQPSRTSNNLNGVAGNDRNQWVVVGDQGTILISSNGKTWTAQTSGTSKRLNRVAWNGKKWVAIGESGTILTSSNRTTWTQQSSGTTNEIRGLTWNESQWMAVSSNNVLTSFDGSVWSNYPTLSDYSLNLYDITWNNNYWSGPMWVAVGTINGGCDSSAIITSPDGANWARQGVETYQLCRHYLYSISGNNTQWVAVGLDRNVGASNMIFASADGINWTRQFSETATKLTSIVLNKKQYISVGDSGAIITSPDGSTWTAQPSGVSNNLMDIAGNEDQLITVGANGTILTSACPSATKTLTVIRSGNGAVTSTPAGINCGTTCSASFDTGATVKLTTNPSSGYQFDGWGGGACSGTGDCKIKLNADKTVSATFTLIPVHYTIAVSKVGTGTVTSEPAGIICGTDCSASFVGGTKVTLTATPTSDYLFGEWSGACSGTQPTCPLTLDADQTVTATFTPKFTELLGVTKNGGTGDGQITSDPAGIDCGQVCFFNFPKNAAVTLTARPDAHSKFTRWGGACSGETAVCTVTLDQSKFANAVFTANSKKQLTVNRTSGGQVTSDPAGINCGQTCQADFDAGSSVTLTATPSSSAFEFIGWAGDCTGLAPTCTVTLDIKRQVEAHFKRAPKFILSVKTVGLGMVTSDPAGITCGVDCQASYPRGSVVNLTAKPQDDAHQFAAWAGDCAQEATPVCTITMAKHQAVTARFTTVKKNILTVQRTGPGTVTSIPEGIDCGSTCEASYASNTQVMLIATWDSATAVFQGWTGDTCSGTGLCVLNMNLPWIVKATFTRK